MGDAATDNVVFGADINSNIIPNTDDTYDLGSSSQEWRNLYIDGTANIDSLIADTADINGGTIDGATIATSDITVGSGKTLNVSAGTLTLADNQISGDKVEGGTIAATTITTLTSTTGNITSVNATTVDTTNLEVTTLKAKDGTTAGSIADSTGIVTVASSVLTTTDINGGTIDGVTIGGSTAAAITGTVLTAKDSNGAINLHRTNTAGVAITQLISDNVGKWQVGMQGSTDDYSVYDVDASANRLTINATTGAATFNSSVTATGTSVFASLDISGDIDVDGTTNLDVVDIDGAVDMASTLTVTGEITANGGIALGDNDKATFGGGDDLQLYHTGSNSYIKDAGTGALIQLTNSWKS